MTRSVLSLRPLLAVDAAMCLACGLVLASAAGALSGMLALPEGLLRGAGLILLPWALFLGWCASRADVPRRAILVVVAVNLLWAADSVVLLASGWVAPNGMGAAFILVQAAAAAGLAVLQALALPPAPQMQRA
jgi:hypothetical protein